MTYSTAIALFAVMPLDCQERILHIYDQIRPSFRNVYEPFIEAVADESTAVEINMLLEHETEETA